ncbi:hypothetical protein A3Q56_04647 [Intoshia linei]|uniref:Uncharacterized protein n=1 Tax=Intoshia linei TaxID=1819745 RepID=A0A177B251_9BILA|nr:hypothetical protein A3Q56_04647 [Intoshia linei]
MSLLSKLFPFSLVGVISSGYILFKYQINSKRYEGDGRLDGQKIVVTGANGAIGSVVSKELARRVIVDLKKVFNLLEMLMERSHVIDNVAKIIKG